MKNLLIGLLTLMLTSSWAHSSELKRCQGKENVEQQALHDEKVESPIFEEVANSCIKKLLGTKIETSTVWHKGGNGSHRYAARFKFHSYIAQLPSGEECIDVYAERYSERPKIKFNEELDFGTKVILYYGLIIPDFKKVDRIANVRDYLNIHMCQ